jgi:hypothetical protein
MSDQVSVTDLVRNFAAACRAMVPHLDRARVPWTDGQQYDDWDRVAEPPFFSLVLGPCRFQAEASLPGISLVLPRYGFPPSGENAFLCLAAREAGECRFVQLRSLDGPFDYCEGQIEGERVLRPLETADLSLVVVDPNGVRHKIETVELDL